MSLAIQTVQTSGINWESIAAITVAITTVMSLLLGILNRSVGNQITAAMNNLRIEVIAKLETRIAILESAVFHRKSPDE